MSDDLVKRLQAACHDAEGEPLDHDGFSNATVEEVELAIIEIVRHRATRKWNIEKDGDDLLLCEGDHERHEGCTMQRWVKAEKVATARREGMEEVERHFRIAAAATPLGYEDHQRGASVYNWLMYCATTIAAIRAAAKKDRQP